VSHNVCGENHGGECDEECYQLLRDACVCREFLVSQGRHAKFCPLARAAERSLRATALRVFLVRRRS